MHPTDDKNLATVIMKQTVFLLNYKFQLFISDFPHNVKTKGL